MTGDWGGIRPSLADQGISFEFFYTLDALANVVGGIRRATEFPGNVDLLLTAELEPLTGWNGGRLFLYGLGNHGGNPSEHVGDFQMVTNIETFDTWKLYEAWFEQELFERKLSFLMGLFDLNSEFDVVPVAEVFLNSSFGVGADLGQSGNNGPSIFSTTSVGARLELRPLESWYLRAVVLDGVPGDPRQPRGTQVVFGEDDGFLLAAEVGFLDMPRRETDSWDGSGPASDPSGKLALGFWGYTSEFDDFLQVDGGGIAEKRRGTYGAYLLGEQRVFHESRDPRDGLSVFGRVGAADDRVNVVDVYVGGGMVYRGLVPGRHDDTIGLGVAAAHFGSAFREAESREGRSVESWEVTLELTCRATVTPWFWVQPDLQFVVNPGGTPDLRDALVVGCRSVLSF